VKARNTTTATIPADADLRCEASGVPDNYRYITWEHTWPGHAPVLRSYPGSDVLQLPGLTYEFSGYYKCRVENGAMFSRNPNAGVGSAYLKVQGTCFISQCYTCRCLRIFDCYIYLETSMKMNCLRYTIVCFRC